MPAQQNPIERYGSARYDVANRRVRDQDGAFQGRNPNEARDTARAAAAETVSPTFSQLQSQGRPRPPQPSPASALQSMFSVAPGGPDASVVASVSPAPGPDSTAAPPATLSPTLLPMMPPPGPPQSAQDDPRWNSILENLEAQFAGQRSRLNEDLARRGIFASSGELGAGARLGDLEGQQARAIASARTEYGMTQDDRYDRLMQMLLPLLLGG